MKNYGLSSVQYKYQSPKIFNHQSKDFESEKSLSKFFSSSLSAHENKLVLHHLFLDFFSIFFVVFCGIRIFEYSICSLLLLGLNFVFLSD